MSWKSWSKRRGRASQLLRNRCMRIMPPDLAPVPLPAWRDFLRVAGVHARLAIQAVWRRRRGPHR